MTAYVAGKPAKAARPAKPAKHKETARSARTTTAKHTAKPKSAKKSAKHAPDAHQKHVAHEEHLARLRGWARPSDLLPACAAEAVAMSLRLAGQRVSDDEVAGLHWAAGGDASRLVSIAGALGAVAEFGLAGCRPVLPPALPQGDCEGARVHAEEVDACQLSELGPCHVDGHGLILGGSAGRDLNPRQPFNARPARCSFAELPALPALILGVNAPGPHCVLATADGWWSWGQLHSPWPCVIEEIVAVSWA